MPLSKPHSEPQPLKLRRATFDAVIFDLDGVVTRTARVHAASWKEMFDIFLRQWAATTGTPWQPFEVAVDYPQYVDGKPRHDGVRDFLASRGITLPEGQPDDPPERDSVWGLGQRKNALYLARLKLGVEVYASSVELIRAVRAAGMKTAVVSASRNCADVLQAAGLSDLFDTRVDGQEAARLGLAGKPAPDVYLEAARRLGVKPARAVVMEDALAGVQAARAGGFGLVIGVDRQAQAQALREAGAHHVVADLEEVRMAQDTAQAGGRSDQLASALQSFDDIKAQLQGRRFAVFLDYDGTLTPIVSRPELAVLSEPARETVRRLAGHCTVVVMSGRDLRDVQARVGIEEIVYGGSHGFEISGPSGMQVAQQQGREFLPSLDAAEQLLRQQLGALPGMLVERKKYSIAVHFRLVEDNALPLIQSTVEGVLAAQPELRVTHGKKIYELQPDIKWDKGRAMRWLLETLGLPDDVFTFYLGDDITDEDAFRALNARGHGMGILVRDEPRDTAAQYALENTDEVLRFLERLDTLATKARA